MNQEKGIEIIDAEHFLVPEDIPLVPEISCPDPAY